MINPKILILTFDDEENFKVKFHQNILLTSLNSCKPSSEPDSEKEFQRVCDSLKEVKDYLLPQKDIEIIAQGKSSVCGKIFKGKELLYSCRDCATDSTCVICRECFLKSEHRKHNYDMRQSSSGGTCDCGDQEAWKDFYHCSVHVSNSEKLSIHQDTIDLSQYTKDIPVSLQISLLKICHVILPEFKTIVMKPLFKENLEQRKSQFLDEKTFIQSIEPTQRCSEVAVVPYNNEYHNFDQVINLFKTTLNSTTNQAMAIANIIDVNGRCLAYVTSNQADAEKRHKEIRDRSINGTRLELLSKLHYPETMAMQNFMIYWLKWLYELIDKYSNLRILICYNLLIGEVKLIDENDQEIIFPKLTFLQDVVDNFNDLWKQPRSACINFIMIVIFKEMYFKKAFAEHLLINYKTLMKQVCEDDHNEKDSIMSTTCQLFTVISVAHFLVEKKNALYEMINVLYELFLSYSKPLPNCPEIYQLQLSDHTMSRKFDPFRRQFWLIFHDIKFILRSILTQITGIGENNDFVTNLPTKTLSEMFINNFVNHIEAFVQILVLLQDMNTIERMTEEHLGMEPQWRSGIQIMMAILESITLTSKIIVSDETLWKRSIELLSKTFYDRVIKYNQDNIKLNYRFLTYEATVINNDWPNKYISVIKPLHRFMAPLLTKKIYRDMLTNEMVDFLIDQALQIVVFSSQVVGRMWIRTGTVMADLGIYIKSTTLYSEMYGRDLELLQEMACQIPCDQFLVKCVHKFNLTDYFNYSVRESEYAASLQCAEDFLRFLVLTIFHRHNPAVARDMDDDKILKYIFFNILCINKMPYSKFIQKLPQSVQNFSQEQINRVLNEISDQSKVSEVTIFRPKKSLISTMYDRFFPYYTLKDQNEAHLYINDLMKDDKNALCEPLEPLDLTDDFSHLYSYLTNDLFVEILNRYLSCCIKQKNGEYWNDRILDMVVYVIGLCLLEDVKLIKSENVEERKLFIEVARSKGNKIDIIGNLEELCDKINNQDQLRTIKWTIKKWYKISKRNVSQSDLLMEVEETATDVVKDEVMSTATEKLSKSDAAKRRRDIIVSKMQSLHQKFISENQTIWDQTNTGLDAKAAPTNSTNNGLNEAKIPDEKTENLFSDKTAVKDLEITEPLFCMVCQEMVDETRPVIALGGAWKSTVLASKGDAAKPIFSNQEESECNEMDHQNTSIPDNEMMPDNDVSMDESLDEEIQRSSSSLSKRPESNKQSKVTNSKVFPVLNNTNNIFITTCGHVMHYSCKEIYLNNAIITKKQYANSKGYYEPRVHNRCPLCKTVSNIDIPIVHTVSASRQPMNSQEQLLISYDDWLNEFAQWPSKESKNIRKLAEKYHNLFQKSKQFSDNIEHSRIKKKSNSTITKEELLSSFCFKTGVSVKLQDQDSSKEMYQANNKFISDIYRCKTQDLIQVCHATAYTLKIWENIFDNESVSFIHKMRQFRRNGLAYLIKATCNASSSLASVDDANKSTQLYIEILQQLLFCNQSTNWSELFPKKIPIFILEVDFYYIYCTLLFLRYMVESNHGKTNGLRFIDRHTFNIYLTKFIFEFITIQTLLSLSSVNIDTDNEVIMQDLINEAPEVWNQDSITKLCDLRKRLIHEYSVIKEMTTELSDSQVVVGFIQSVLPFLRCASFLLTVIGDIPLISSNYTSRYKESVDLMNQMNLGLISSHLEANESIPRRVRSLCDQLIIDKVPYIHSMPISRPRLIQLPDDFVDVITYCFDRGCSENPNQIGNVYELALCLLCGKPVCLTGYCCHVQGSLNSKMNGAKLHANRCHSGYSVYLSCNSARIIVYFYHAYWSRSFDPIYTDRFGEAGADLDRNYALFLNKAAYCKTENNWLEHRSGTVIDETNIGNEFFT